MAVIVARPVVAPSARPVVHGVPGPQGAPGLAADIATRTTVLRITEYCPAGSNFFVNSSGTHYTKDPLTNDGFVGETEGEFLANEKYQICVSCLWVNKIDHVQWTTPYSFNFLSEDLYGGDFIKIIS